MKIDKVCTYAKSKCETAEAKHQATTYKYPARLKEQAEAWKEKSEKL